MQKIALWGAALIGLSSTACIGVSQSQGSSGARSSAGPTPFKADKSLQICKNGVRVASDGLIDDFEDGNTQLMVIAGRDGYWWKAHDPNGSTIGPEDSTPVPQGVNGSLGMYMTGQTSSEEGAWGVNFGANFKSEKETYDASKYAGITFKAKVGPNSTKKIRFKVSDVNTHEDLGVCTSCWNHFGKDFTLSEEYKEYTALFSELRQMPGWGDPRPPSITPSALYSFDFSIDKSAVFEIWVDDVQFLECK